MAFDTGATAEWINHVEVIEKIIVGRNLTTGLDQFTLARQLLKGKAKDNFEKSVTENQRTQSIAHLKAALNNVGKEIFPKQAIGLQRRALRCHVSKPQDMKTAAFYAWLLELNKMLTKFPKRQGQIKTR